MKKLARILPFMEKSELKELAYKIMNKEVEGIKLFIVFPFLDRADFDEIVDLLIQNNDSKNLERAIPFASKTKIDAIQEAIISGKITGIDEYRLYPFLSKDKLKGMFDQILKEAKDNPQNDDDDEDDDE